jgi:hypothetical protein
MILYLIAIPLIMHGLANSAGVLASWTRFSQGFSNQPWIFSRGVELHTPIGRAFGGLWLLSAVGFISAGAGVLLVQTWWPALAIAAAACSLAAILPWWNTVPPGARFGAIFDALVIMILVTYISELIVRHVH